MPKPAASKVLVKKSEKPGSRVVIGLSECERLSRVFRDVRQTRECVFMPAPDQSSLQYFLLLTVIRGWVEKSAAEEEKVVVLGFFKFFRLRWKL